MQRKLLHSILPLCIALLIPLIAIVSINSKGGNVLGTSYPPSYADVKAKTGGTVTRENVTLIVSEDTFDDDVYFRVDKIARKNPISVDGLWQVSDLWEARVKYMVNNDQVSEYAAHKNYILAFPYTTQHLTTDQGVAIPQESLKLVRGETATGPWTVLSNCVIDQANKTVSVITNRGGFFMISGGFYKPASNTAFNAIILNENEVVVTITPVQDLISPTEEK